MCAYVVAVCDGTLGSGAHIPEGKSTHAFRCKPVPVHWWVNISKSIHDTQLIGLSAVWTVESCIAILKYKCSS